MKTLFRCLRSLFDLFDLFPDELTPDLLKATFSTLAD